VAPIPLDVIVNWAFNLRRKYFDTSACEPLFITTIDVHLGLAFSRRRLPGPVLEGGTTFLTTIDGENVSFIPIPYAIASSKACPSVRACLCSRSVLPAEKKIWGGPSLRRRCEDYANEMWTTISF
jgi:hypothetical protein